MYVAKYTLIWKDLINEIKSPKLLPAIIDNHFPKPKLELEPVHIWCLVCGLETSTWKSHGIQIVDTCD